MPESVMDWWAVVGVVAGVLAAVAAWLALRGRRGGSITVKNSPKADVVGGNRGRKASSDMSEKRTILVKDSTAAKVTGNDASE